MRNHFLTIILFVISFPGFSQTYSQGLHFIYITTDSMEVYYKKDDNIVKQRSYKINSNLTSTKLSYSNNNFTSSVVINEFVNDTSISIYRWAVADKIEQKADSLKNIISSGNVEKYSELVDSMTYYILDSIPTDTLRTELFQVTFYHNSILKSIRRFNNGADSCFCTSYPGYVGGLTSFYCSQDVIFDFKDLKGYLEDSIHIVQEEDAEYLISFLDGYKNEQISYAEISKKIFEEDGGVNSPPIFVARVCPMAGTACGCCGNYQGPCIFCSVNCLIHDFYCWKKNCKPRRVCFSGCQPTPCY